MAAPKSSSSANKIDLEGTLLLEQPFLRLPHEELRRQLRTHQRLVERDLTFVATTLGELQSKPAQQQQAEVQELSNEERREAAVQAALKRRLEGESGTGEIAQPQQQDTELQKTLDVMIGRLRGLKRKVGWL